MTEEKKLPKFPEVPVCRTEKERMQWAYRVIDWRSKLVVALEKRLKPIEKAIKDIHSRDESTWGIGTTVNLGVLHDKAGLLSEFIEALK